MKYRIRWSQDKIAKSLVDSEVKKAVEYERFALFGHVTLAQELLPKFSEVRTGIPFLNIQVADGIGRAGDRSGSFDLWVDPDGSAWIEWSIGLTDVSTKTLERHKEKNFNGMISHTVANIQRNVKGKWE